MAVPKRLSAQKPKPPLPPFSGVLWILHYGKLRILSKEGKIVRIEKLHYLYALYSLSSQKSDKEFLKNLNFSIFPIATSEEVGIVILCEER